MEASTTYIIHSDKDASKDFIIGLLLAISSTLFIGSSFIIKKIGLNRLNRRGSLRAGMGGFGYLKEWVWWLGFLTMAIGELANFAAYTFAPASLVTPLGALSVIVSAVLASKFLNENLNLLGKLGCLLCILGSTIIILNTPFEENITTLSELLLKFQTGIFKFYFFFVLMTFLLIFFKYGPRYGERNIFVYIVLCAVVGSLTVMLCKGLGLGVKAAMSGEIDISSDWTIYFLSLGICTCITIQLTYLNKSLDLFNASVVTPIYYVIFTTMVIATSTIVFNEWSDMSARNVIGCLCGFLIVIIAIFMLNAFRNFHIAFADINDIFEPRNYRNPRHHNYSSVYGTA